MKPVGRWLLTVASVCGLLAVSAVVAPHLSISPAAGALVAFVCVCLAVLVVSVSTPVLPRRALVWLAVPIAVLAAFAVVPQIVRAPFGVTAVAASLLVGGTVAGGVIGARIEHPSHLFVAAYVSSLADLYSVFSTRGVTAQVVESERWLSILAISWPVLGTSDIEPMLGVGDVIVCAIYAVAARQLGLGMRRTTLALAGGFALVLIALLVFAMPLPALPFLGAAFVAAHPVTLRFRKGEKRTAAIGLAIATLVFAALWLV